MKRFKRIPMINVARTWCDRYRRRGDGHRMMFCAECNASRRRFWKAIRSFDPAQPDMLALKAADAKLADFDRSRAASRTPR